MKILNLALAMGFPFLGYSEPHNEATIKGVFRDPQSSSDPCAHFIWELGTYFNKMSDPLFALTTTRPTTGIDVEAHFRLPFLRIENPHPVALSYVGTVVGDSSVSEGIQVKNPKEFERQAELIRVFAPSLVTQRGVVGGLGVSDQTKRAVAARLMALKLPDIQFTLASDEKFPASISLKTDLIDMDLILRLLEIDGVEKIEIGSKSEIILTKNLEADAEIFPIIMEIKTFIRFVSESELMVRTGGQRSEAWNLFSGLLTAKDVAPETVDFFVRWNDSELSPLVQVKSPNFNHGAVPDTRSDPLQNFLSAIWAHEVPGASMKVSNVGSAHEDQTKVLESVVLKIRRKQNS